MRESHRLPIRDRRSASLQASPGPRGLLTLLILILALPGPAAAAPIGCGPSAAGITCAAAAPDSSGTWFLGTESGMYRRTSAEPTWVRCTPGAPLNSVRCLAVSVHRPGWVLASVVSAGLLRSSDNGSTWVASGQGLGTGAVVRLAESPLAPGLFLAATGAGVYRSTDYGATWSPRGLAGENVVVVALDPTDAAQAWAAVYGEGVYRTTDGGATWGYSSDGMEGGFIATQDIRAGANGDTVLAAADQPYRSVDGGAHWTRMLTLPPSAWFYALAMPYGDARRTLVATAHDIYRTTNGGDRWTGMQVPVVGAGYIGGLNVFGSADGRGYFLAGASHGQLFLGHAEGSDWKAYETGISGGDIKAAEAAGSHWLAGGLNGAWFSKDAGASWLRSGFVHNAAVEPHGFAFSPTNSDSAWCVGTNMYAKALIFRTSDAGRIWRVVLMAEGGDGAMTDVKVDPTNTRRVYVAAAMAGTPVVYRTADDGATWMPSAPLGQFGISRLLLDPADPSVVLLGTWDGVYRSTDYGATFVPRGPSGGGIWDLTADATHPGRFYAAAGTNGVWVSTDSGLTWNPMPSGPSASVRRVDATSTSLGLVAGTSDQGVWRYNGLAWVPFAPEDQPISLAVQCLTPVQQTGGLLVGTGGAGLAYYPGLPMDISEMPEITAPRLRIAGSPSAGPFGVSLGVLLARPTRLDIFDAGGRNVRTLAGYGPGGGGPSWVWDGRDDSGQPVSSGVYVARTLAAGTTWSGKICLMR